MPPKTEPKSTSGDKLNFASSILQNLHLRGISQELSTQTAYLKEIDSNMAEMSDSRSALEKQIKSAVFSISEQLDFIENLESGLARYIEVINLHTYIQAELVIYINRLVEISDQEFASNVMEKLHARYESAFREMSPSDRHDWKELQRLDAEIQNLGRQVEGMEAEQRQVADRLWKLNEEATTEIKEPDNTGTPGFWEHPRWKNLGRTTLLAFCVSWVGVLGMCGGAAGAAAMARSNTGTPVIMIIAVSSMILATVGALVGLVVGIIWIVKIIATRMGPPTTAGHRQRGRASTQDARQQLEARMGQVEGEREGLQTQFDEIKSKMARALDEVGGILKEHGLVDNRVLRT